MNFAAHTLLIALEWPVCRHTCMYMYMYTHDIVNMHVVSFFRNPLCGPSNGISNIIRTEWPYMAIAYTRVHGTDLSLSACMSMQYATA